MAKIYSLLLFLSFPMISFSQQGVVLGTVSDINSKEPIIGATIFLEGTTIGTSTDISGKFRLDRVPVGTYNILISFVGYKTEKRFNVIVSSGNAQILNVELTEDTNTLSEIEISSSSVKSASVADIVTPLSVQSLTTEEIRSNPGGNFDISRVVQILPGVGSNIGGAGSRNDVIIRGGAPNENVYYLDGIEIPLINHFTTQGSAGGAAGILNVSFIEDVKLSSSSFDARYDNALASVFQFKQRDGNPERHSGNLRLSASEFSSTFEGPLSEKTTYLVSGRRSYLQFLFQLLDLPIRPNYWDFQYKVTHKLNDKTTISAIGVGAIDEFSFATSQNISPENDFIIRANPIINQWNYTSGISIRRLIKNGYLNLALSRNGFKNQVERYEDGRINDLNFRNLDINSLETENKLRLDVNKNINGWKIGYGAMAQYVSFTNSIFNKVRNEVQNEQGEVVQPAVTINYRSDLDFYKYGAFVQVSRSFLQNRLGASLGARTDMNSFTTTGTDPIQTLSPRFSLSYSLSERWSLSGSIGSYYKLPVYTVLGFQSENGTYGNKNAAYINSVHYVTGLEYLPKEDLRFTLEAFYKDYSNYPISVRDGISLANLGGEFGAIGNELITSSGKGRAMGFEFYFQKKLTKNLFTVFSYTFVRSEFTGADGTYRPSSWDNRHLVSALLGRKLPRNWEIGLKHRFAGGIPFTPFDMEASQRNYIALGTGILDYNNINSERTEIFNQFDFRIDKKWNFKAATIDLFLDVTNALLFPNPVIPQFTFRRTEDGNNWLTTDGQPLRPDASNAEPVTIRNRQAIVTPSIGFIVEF